MRLSITRSGPHAYVVTRDRTGGSVVFTEHGWVAGGRSVHSSFITAALVMCRYPLHVSGEKASPALSALVQRVGVEGRWFTVIKHEGGEVEIFDEGATLSEDQHPQAIVRTALVMCTRER